MLQPIICATNTNKYGRMRRDFAFMFVLSSALCLCSFLHELKFGTEYAEILLHLAHYDYHHLHHPAVVGAFPLMIWSTELQI